MEAEDRPIVKSLQSLRALHSHDRLAEWGALNDLFRSGLPPDPPVDGPQAGVLLALHMAPGLTQFFRYIAARWMPWQGKTFDPRRNRGSNVFTRDSLGLAHVFWPFYRGYQDDGPNTYRAFEFQTRVAAGLFDPDRQVLKIDYNLPFNPGLSIRRVLDELVQVDNDGYLGKAHLKWWWGKWQTVAFFSLSRPQG